MRCVCDWRPAIASWYITVSIVFGSLENTYWGTFPCHTSQTWLFYFL